VNKPTRSVVSLFSGCGGLDLGIAGGFNALSKSVGHTLKKTNNYTQINRRWVNLANTGFEIKFINDINPIALRSYKANIPVDEETKFDPRSIVDIVKCLNKKDDKSLIDGEVDLLLGGFPCQDFSLSGYMNGFRSHKTHDNKSPKNGRIPAYLSRGSLYNWMRKVIEIVRPKVFIAENVDSIKYLEGANDKIVKDLNKMANSGYEIFVKTLNAADYGVPQNRKRVFFVGYDKNMLNPSIKDNIRDYSPFPKPTHNSKSRLNGSSYNPYVTVKNALGYLNEPHIDKKRGLLDQNYYSKASLNNGAQGQTAVKDNRPSMTIRANHHGNIEFRRLEEQDGKKRRRLSIRECALLQTFPPEFNFVIPDKNIPGRFEVSMSKAYQLIGNAVPPLLGFHFATRLNEIWNKVFIKE